MMHLRLRLPLLARAVATILVVALSLWPPRRWWPGPPASNRVRRAPIGGPGHAEMYPSGMEIAPDGSIVVADTGNHQVAKYGAGGTPLWRVGQVRQRERPVRPPPGRRDRQSGQRLRGRHGEHAGREARAHRAAGSPPGRVPSTTGWARRWAYHRHDDVVYVADAGKQRVRVFTSSGMQLQRDVLQRRSALRPGARRRRRRAGNVYVANYIRTTTS